MSVTREDVVDQTVAEILEANIQPGPFGMLILSVPGMPCGFDPDARAFEDAVRARLGDGYTFGLVLVDSAMVTRLSEEVSR